METGAIKKQGRVISGANDRPSHVVLDLTEYLIRKPKERKLNRFSCSELYYLLQGYTPVKDYVEGKKITPVEAWRMELGTIKHRWIEMHLVENFCCIEEKIEKTFDEIEIVGVADAYDVERKWGLEIKTSDKKKDKATKAHEYQARMYCSMFEIPVWYIAQPVLNDTKAYLNIIGEVKRNDLWFKKEIEKIKNYYNLNLKNYGTKKL